MTVQPLTFVALSPLARRAGASVARHEWYWNKRTNPMLIWSEPPGWDIIKRAEFDYELWHDSTPPGKPHAVNRDWQALAEIADKATP